MMIKNIFWDFDGVILNSNKVRDLGFLKVLGNYPKNEVNELIAFHQHNGGLSRYVKFKYFFENIRGENLTDNDLKTLTEQFSVIMRELLVNKDLLIKETVAFIKREYEAYRMHVTSGSDEKELNFLNDKLGIKDYFISIKGSPTPKSELVSNLIKKHNYKLDECVLIGDSINDYEAASSNNIFFLGYGPDKNIISKSNIVFPLR